VGCEHREQAELGGGQGRGPWGERAAGTGKLGSLGFEVTLCRIPEPEPDGTDPAQAA